MRYCLVLFCCCIFSVFAVAQGYRTIDGTGNNPIQPQWGNSGANILRYSPVGYDDDISSPRQEALPNPRIISNIIFSQNQDIFEANNHSDFMWVFGQFIDHDITLIPTNKLEPIDIEVPACDPNFDPNCTGNSIIPLNRAYGLSSSGTGVSNPRQYFNQITAFIDGSNIYGSDSKRQSWLRTFEGGKLKTSEGNLLPFNTLDGKSNGVIDIDAPEMDMMNPSIDRWFVAGDVRANENVLLTSIHTLFLREHNRLCKHLALSNPTWSEEQLYQEAKKINNAILQHIVYDEWLPMMGIYLPEYRGFRTNVNPNIRLAFAAAAFRMGHTMLNSNILLINDDCEAGSNGNTNLLNSFFNPQKVITEGGIESFVKGMSAQKMQEMDGKLVDDVRNFLFGPPEAGIGMDLAAINIQRGREMGLPSINTIRLSLGLPAFVAYDEMCFDSKVINNLEALYGDIDNIDPWVGMLVEDHMPESMVGETIMETLKLQFTALRDGDRFFYRHDGYLSNDELDIVESSSLSKIIIRNTEIRFMQEDAFLAEPACEHANLGIEENDLEIIAYPTLLQGDSYKLGIYSDTDQSADVFIFDRLGRIHATDRLNLATGVNLFEMNAAGWHQGQYIIKIVTEEKTNQVSLIKNY